MSYCNVMQCEIIDPFSVFNCFDFSRESSFGEKHFRLQKRQMSPEVKCPAVQEKSGNFQSDLDIRCTEMQRSSEFELDLAQHNIKLCNCKASDMSSDLLALDKIRELVSRGQESHSRSKTTNQAVPSSSSDVPLCHSCRDVEQRRLMRPARPRSVDVTRDIKIDIQGHRYENVEHFLRIPPRAASGSCLDIDTGKNEDVEEVQSQASSSTTVTTPVCQITSSASVDTAISHAARVCRCNDIDLISYQLMHNSVELDSAAKNPGGVSEHCFRRNPEAVDSTAKNPGRVSEHCFRRNPEAQMLSNQTTHCSRNSGEVPLLNNDLLKHCSRHTHSVSMPIDIVSARRLPPDQKISNSLSSAVNTTTTASHGQELQPICSAYSILPADEMKAVRKRAYRVGLNLFNR